jgi:hypothetical protein
MSSRGDIWLGKVPGRGIKWPIIEHYDYERFNVCKSEGRYGAQLSPMKLGPVIVDGEVYAHNVEDAWQCSKVSKEHVGVDGEPVDDWYKHINALRLDGKGLRRRYPKHTPIAYSYFKGRHYGYVGARHAMYIPWYVDLAQKTDAYKSLHRKHLSGVNLLLLEYDAPSVPTKLNLKMLNSWKVDKNMVFGHGAVLAHTMLSSC